MKRKILLIEQNRTDGEATKALLEKMEYNVFSVYSVKELALQIAFFGPDLIISETDVSGKSGLEICTQIRLYSKKIPILFYTQEQDEYAPLILAAAGSSFFLSKTEGNSALVKVIEQLLGEENVFA